MDEGTTETLKELVQRLRVTHQDDPSFILMDVNRALGLLPFKEDPKNPSRWYTSGYVHGFLHHRWRPDSTVLIHQQAIWYHGYIDGKADADDNA